MKCIEEQEVFQDIIFKGKTKTKKIRRLSNPVLQNHILLQMVDFFIAGHMCHSRVLVKLPVSCTVIAWTK